MYKYLPVHEQTIPSQINDHKLSGLKLKKCILLQLWRPDVQLEFPQAEAKVSARPCSLCKLQGPQNGVFLPFPASRSAFLGSWLLLYNQSQQHNIFRSLPPSLVKQFSVSKSPAACLTKTPVIAFRAQLDESSYSHLKSKLTC